MLASMPFFAMTASADAPVAKPAESKAATHNLLTIFIFFSSILRRAMRNKACAALSRLPVQAAAGRQIALASTSGGTKSCTLNGKIRKEAPVQKSQWPWITLRRLRRMRK